MTQKEQVWELEEKAANLYNQITEMLWQGNREIEKHLLAAKRATEAAWHILNLAWEKADDKE